MKVVLIGAVSSSLQILKKLIEYEFDLVGVFGLEPEKPELVSGLENFRPICDQNSIPYFSFKKINDEINISQLIKLKPDIIFAVGFSQLISETILNIPALGCIGFHPTKLPAGRGRAAIAWLIMKEKEGAATFFHMGKGADDGPIFVRQVFNISSLDDATSVKNKILNSIDLALDSWLPQLKKGIWNPIPQDEANATYYERRTKLDGWIDWELSDVQIDKLIRASTRPYPGAFTFYKDSILVVWKCSIEKQLKICGIPGRVLLKRDQDLLIQTGKGLIWILEYEIQNLKAEDTEKPKIKVGEKLGYNVEYEIYKLKQILLK